MDGYNGYLGSLGFNDSNTLGQAKTQSPALGNDSPAPAPQASGQLGGAQTQSPAASQLGAGFGASPPPPSAPAAAPAAGASFATADAARQTANVQNQLALSRAGLEQAGTQQRQGINYDAEDRGIFNSGIRGNSLAIQQGQQANQEQQLEAGAATDVGNIQAQMQKQLAAEAISRQQQAAQQEQAQLQLQYLQQQIGSQGALSKAQLDYQNSQNAQQQQLYQQQLALQRYQAGLG